MITMANCGSVNWIRRKSLRPRAESWHRSTRVTTSTPQNGPAQPLRHSRDLLNAAGMGQGGIVTLDELTGEIFYRAGRNKDGTVTAGEPDEAIRSGVLGPVPWNADLPLSRE